MNKLVFHPKYKYKKDIKKDVDNNKKLAYNMFILKQRKETV